MSTQHTLVQAMILLGTPGKPIDRNTLKRWMIKLGIESTDHPLEHRVKLLSAEQVEQLREAMTSVHGLVALPQPRHVVPPVAPVQEDTVTRVAIGSASQPQRTPIPDGWVSLRGFATMHGIDARTIHPYRSQIAHHGHWFVDGRWVDWLIDEEQRQKFIEIFSERKGV